MSFSVQDKTKLALVVCGGDADLWSHDVTPLIQHMLWVRFINM